MPARWLITSCALLLVGCADPAPDATPQVQLLTASDTAIHTSPEPPPIEPEVLMQAHCLGCHSQALIASQRGDEAFWLNTIRWMQRTQNLWPIPPDQESALVSYLADTYAEEAWGRRPQLSPTLIRKPD
ncbi:MAG: hypothetical protein AAF529_19425 [Pseudomonadota bacterium]